MLLSVFSMFDKKAKVYHAPFLAHNGGDAMRMVKTQMRNNPQSTYAEYPEDFSLNMVSIFDDKTGIMEPGRVETIVEIINLVEKKQNE